MATTFHFSRETPPDSMFSDFQALNKFQNEQFSDLTQYVFLFLTDPAKSSRLMTQLEEFAQQNGLGVAALKNVVKSLLAMPNYALKKSLSPSQLQEDLENLGVIACRILHIRHTTSAKKFAKQVPDQLNVLVRPQVHGLSDDKAAYFTKQFQANQAVLSKGALDLTLMVNQLVDMEWKFGVTASSSELDRVGNTFLQLKLVINTGNGTKNVYMELSLPQFYSFLHEMEKAKASLEYLS